MKKILTALFIGSLSFSLQAQTLKLSEDQAVEMSLQNNLGLQQSSTLLQSKKRSRDKAWNALIPSINASAGYAVSGSPFTQPTVNSPLGVTTDLPLQQNFSGGVGLTLPLNAAIGSGIKQTILDYESGLLGYEDAKKQMELSVRKSYNLFITLKADIELTQLNIDIAQKRYEQAKDNYQNGLLSELEVLQAQVTAENYKPQLNSKIINYDNQIMNFKLLLGLPVETELELDGNLRDIQFFNFDTEDLINKYSANRLDVLQINKQIEILKNSKSLKNRLNRTPTLNLRMNWQGQVGSDFVGESWETGIWSDYGSAVNLSLNMPLDSFIPGSSKDVEVKNIEDQIKASEIQKQSIFDSAEIEITNTVNNLKQSIQNITTYQLNIELAQKSFDLTNEAYRLGTRELLDVETAQKELISAQQAVLQEQYNYISQLLDLGYALNVDDIESILQE